MPWVVVAICGSAGEELNYFAQWSDAIRCARAWYETLRADKGWPDEPIKLSNGFFGRSKNVDMRERTEGIAVFARFVGVHDHLMPKDAHIWPSFDAWQSREISRNPAGSTEPGNASEATNGSH
jgi:hypothetical protein